MSTTEPNQPWLTTPVAVLVGSVVISLAILVSNGVITVKGSKAKEASSGNVQGAQSAPDLGKIQAQVGENLKKYAGRLSLDQKKFDSCLDAGQKSLLVAADQKDGAGLGVNGTPAVFINGHLISGSLPYQIFRDVIDFELESGDWNSPNRAVQLLMDGVEDPGAGNFELGKGLAKIVRVDSGNNPPQGNPQAKVTMVEFSDYQCPFCARLYSEVIRKLRSEYIDTGKVKLFYRDYPLNQIIPQTGLPLHPGAEKAAQAVRCAGDQEKYWQFHDLIFESQADIF